jgi:hypothetical protein
MNESSGSRNALFVSSVNLAKVQNSETKNNKLNKTKTRQVSRRYFDWR